MKAADKTVRFEVSTVSKVRQEQPPATVLREPFEWPDPEFFHVKIAKCHLSGYTDPGLFTNRGPMVFI